jgi:hypothetical protein
LVAPGQGVEQIALQSWVPSEAKDDKALDTARSLLYGGHAKARAIGR